MSDFRSDYRLWVNRDRTVLVRLWADGRLELATRPDTDAVWDPPMYLEETHDAYRR